MFKCLGTIIIALLAIGAGLSLYLPEYNSKSSSEQAFQLVTDSLNVPIDASLLESSQTLFNSSSEEKPEYGLQLGIYGSQEVSELNAVALEKKDLDLPFSPSIMQLADEKRRWFILALGPFSSKSELKSFQKIFDDNHINTQLIIWPL